jgi:pimeloyl-ACP methyl ester carboxylesterase
VVAYLDGGDPDGYPVFGLHGTPGCRLSRWPVDNVYGKAGVRYVTTDRAGYGQSSRRRGRVVADEASDVLAVADALGIEQFAVVGGSGGGPHALACAALLSGRVDRVACQSGIAPLGGGGMTREAWIEGMADEHAVELDWAEAGEAVLQPRMVAAQRRMAERATNDPGNVLGEDMSESDRAFLLRPEVIRAFALIVAEQAAHGVGGSVDDTLAFARAWGFDLGSITVPVLVTHGAQDASAPLAHGEWLAAHIPSAELRISETGGHLPEDPEVEIAETMAWLRDAAPTSAA